MPPARCSVRLPRGRHGRRSGGINDHARPAALSITTGLPIKSAIEGDVPKGARAQREIRVGKRLKNCRSRRSLQGMVSPKATSRTEPNGFVRRQAARKSVGGYLWCHMPSGSVPQNAIKTRLPAATPSNERIASSIESTSPCDTDAGRREIVSMFCCGSLPHSGNKG